MSSSGSSTSKTANGAPRVSSTIASERTLGSANTLPISPYVSIKWAATLPVGRSCSSFRAITTTAPIEPMKSHPHIFMKPPSVVRPLLWRRMKPTYAMKKSSDWPMALQVAPSSRFGADSTVSARPSTAMSWVAASA